jgi:hypothetical protein
MSVKILGPMDDAGAITRSGIARVLVLQAGGVTFLPALVPVRAMAVKTIIHVGDGANTAVNGIHSWSLNM